MMFCSGQFRPLGYALLAVPRTFLGPEHPAFWHGLLIFFHLLNTLLVFFIARSFSQRFAVGLAAAAAFGLHPMATVIVNNVNEFHILLGLTFSLAAILTYVSFSNRGSKFFYWLTVTFFVLGLFTGRLAVSVPLVLLAYESFYQRTDFRRMGIRLAPFLLAILLFIPVWTAYEPHPLHYKYVPTHEGSFWHGFFSVVGATGQYAGALLFAHNVPVPLHEIVERIFQWNNPKFLLWILGNAVIFGAAVWFLAKRRWAALGLIIAFLAMAPYASVGYNRVVEYVSWSYLYFPVAGVALFLAGLYDRVSRLHGRSVKIWTHVLVAAVLLFWTVRTVQLNYHSRTPFHYWKHVCLLNPNSQIAVYEIGKLALDAGDVPFAVNLLFAPTVKELKQPCLAMARHYCRQEDFLSAAIHLRQGIALERMGIVLRDACEVTSELLWKAGALDHAEENLGKLLMVDPYDTRAMALLAQVWFEKGFVHEAHRILDRAKGIAPNNETLRRIAMRFKEKEEALEDSVSAPTIAPPEPEWLRYVLTQTRTPDLRRKIVTLSNTSHPEDPIIQLEAAISLLESDEYALAAEKADRFMNALQGNPYACAVACRACALSGKAKRGIQLGTHAVMLDQQSDLAWGSLALACSRQERFSDEFKDLIERITSQPQSACLFYHHLGLQKSRMGREEEAIESFQKALAANPRYTDARKALGTTLQRIGNSAHAVESLEKAAAENPGDAEIQANLGKALINEKQFAESLPPLRKALQIDPTNASYHFSLGSALTSLERWEDAIKEYGRTIELKPDYASAHYKLGNCLVRLGNKSEAAKHYRTTIEIAPKHPYVRYNLGVILSDQGKKEEAVKKYREEIRVNPRFPHPYSNLIIHYCREQEQERAEEVAKEAEKLGVQLHPNALSVLREK